MNLERIRIFLSVVDAGSVSAAGKQVHLSQPAVSRNLQQLEEELATLLFDREGRALRLTPAGKALVPAARGLLEHARALQASVRESAERGYHDVRIGSVDSVATFLLGSLVTPLRTAYPDLGVQLTTGRTQALLERLAADELDLALIACSGEPSAARATRVGRYDLQYYGRKDLFPRLSRARTEADLVGFPLVEIDALPGQATMIPRGARSFARAASLGAVKALVLGGFGVGSMLGFMLTRPERETLVKARIPHDPACALYLAAAPGWRGDGAKAIEETLLANLRVA